MMKNLFCVAIFSVLYVSVQCGSFEETMKQTTDMVRQVCQPKFKVTDEQMNGIKDGVFPDDKNFKCFIHCTLEMLGMMKKNKVDFEKTMKQFETLLPAEIKGDWINALNICKDKVEVVKNGCDLAMNIVKCFKDNNPKFTF